MNEKQKQYMTEIMALNNAAYAVLRGACKDTVALPEIDRQAIRNLAAETDRLVDQGLTSGI